MRIDTDLLDSRAQHLGIQELSAEMAPQLKRVATSTQHHVKSSSRAIRRRKELVSRHDELSRRTRLVDIVAPDGLTVSVQVLLLSLVLLLIISIAIGPLSLDAHQIVLDCLNGNAGTSTLLRDTDCECDLVDEHVATTADEGDTSIAAVMNATLNSSHANEVIGTTASDLARCTSPTGKTEWPPFVALLVGFACTYVIYSTGQLVSSEVRDGAHEAAISCQLACLYNVLGQLGVSLSEVAHHHIQRGREELLEVSGRLDKDVEAGIRDSERATSLNELCEANIRAIGTLSRHSCRLALTCLKPTCCSPFRLDMLRVQHGQSGVLARPYLATMGSSGCI